MQNNYLVIYKRWGIDFTECPENWRKVTQLVNYMDTYGGYAHTILENNTVVFTRHIDEENGTDFWTDMKGDTINLEQISDRG